MPKIDFSNVQTEFKPREAGEYEATFMGATDDSAKSQYKFDWAEVETPSKHIYAWYSYKPAALWKLKRDAIRMGADVEEMNSPSCDMDVILEGLIGYVHTLVIGEPRLAVNAAGEPVLDDKGNQKVYDNFLEVKDPNK